jgi:DNA-directed RNA polymerase subunit M/transcription elongation factor TFIIS
MEERSLKDKQELCERALRFCDQCQSMLTPMVIRPDGDGQVSQLAFACLVCGSLEPVTEAHPLLYERYYAEEAREIGLQASLPENAFKKTKEICPECGILRECICIPSASAKEVMFETYECLTCSHKWEP